MDKGNTVIKDGSPDDTRAELRAEWNPAVFETMRWDPVLRSDLSARERAARNEAPCACARDRMPEDPFRDRNCEERSMTCWEDTR